MKKFNFSIKCKKCGSGNIDISIHTPLYDVDNIKVLVECLDCGNEYLSEDWFNRQN